MRLLDGDFRKYPLHYILQSLLAGSILGIVLHYLSVATQGLITASLGATTFILFATPQRALSNGRYVIGGYVVSGLVGFGISFLATRIGSSPAGISLSGGIAVACAMLSMALTDTEHPPAAAFALGLVVNPMPAKSIIYVIAAVAGLWTLKTVLRSRLIDLLGTTGAPTLR